MPLPVGGAQSQLVEGQDFTSSFKDTLTGLGGDVKSSNRQLRDVEQPQVVGDGSNDDGDLVLSSVLLHVSDKRGEGQWGTMDAGHKKSLQNDAVEFGIGTTGQETVKLDKQTQIDILGLWLGPVDLAILVVPDVDTHDSIEGKDNSKSLSIARFKSSKVVTT